LFRYISIIDGFYRKAPEIDAVSINILEQFAWRKHLSAYDIFSKLKSTKLQMAYKNVNKRIHCLVSLNLIKETEEDIENVNKHNAKYYDLTEYGIYQLFLNKLSQLSMNQLDTAKLGKSPSSDTLILFHNYHNSLLFESFLYPYFKKETLFSVGDYLLWKLYRYLSDCCRRIVGRLKYYDYGTPITDPIFYWNKVQADNEKLLLHLKEQFHLESIDFCKIVKNNENNDTITIKTSTAPIILKYDRENEKVIAMSTVGGKYKEFIYSTSKLGSDILVAKDLSDEELLVDIITDAKKQMQHLIYEFIYDLASESERVKEFYYYHKILSQDKKFMAAVEDLYKNRHKAFEKGYKMLTTNTL
jgi:hypothetical protein